MEAFSEWNARNGRTFGVVFLPVAAEAGLPSAYVLTLASGDDAWEGKADAGTGSLILAVTEGASQRPNGRLRTFPAGQPLIRPFGSPTELSAALQSLLSECCSSEESVVAVMPLFPQPPLRADELGGLYERWEAEKAKCPPTLGAAKKILQELGTRIDTIAGQDAIDPLSLKREIAELARYRVRTDEGQSYIQFWQRGDRAFERLARADSESEYAREAAAAREGCGR